MVVPETALLTKIEACRALGAEITQVGSSLEEATDHALEVAARDELTFISPYDDWDIIAGQASCGLEILEDLPDVTTVLVPLGGGGLLSGITLGIKLQRPDVRLIGVQSDAVAPWRHFLDDGTFEETRAGSRTIADGISVKAPGQRTREVIARDVDEIVTADDDAIAEAIVKLLERTRTMAEGGAVAAAALLKHRVKIELDEKVVCVVSGGNIDMTLVGRSIDYGLTSSGRLLRIAVTLPDTPGQLARLVNTAADLGMNVRHVEHGRGEMRVPVGLTEITLEMETRDREHQHELMRQLSEQGLAVRELTALS